MVAVPTSKTYDMGRVAGAGGRDHRGHGFVVAALEDRHHLVIRLRLVEAFRQVADAVAERARHGVPDVDFRRRQSLARSGQGEQCLQQPSRANHVAFLLLFGLSERQTAPPSRRAACLPVCAQRILRRMRRGGDGQRAGGPAHPPDSEKSSAIGQTPLE